MDSGKLNGLPIQEVLQIADKRREGKGKGEWERYAEFQLNPEFQKIVSRDKKGFLLLLLLRCLSRVRLCATPETAAHQAPPSLGFSRQEHWSGLTFLSPLHESEK